MKTVILFRHGKSDWHADFDRDHERPLAPRGKKASKAMGKWLTKTDQVPEYCIVSSALRTRETYDFANKAGEWDVEMVVENRLYDSTVTAYLDIIRQVPEHVDRVLVVGHEPTCSGTTSALAGEADIRFPTATMARIDLHVEGWQEASFGCGTLIWLQPPRFLGK